MNDDRSKSDGVVAAELSNAVTAVNDVPVAVTRENTVVLVTLPGELPKPVPMSQLCAHPRAMLRKDSYSGHVWCGQCGHVIHGGDMNKVLMRMDDNTRAAIERDKLLYGCAYGEMAADGHIHHIPTEMMVVFGSPQALNTFYTGDTKSEPEFKEQFRLEPNGEIVGHGLRWGIEMQPRPGLVQLNVSLLNRLYDLAMLEAKLNSDAKRGK